MKNKNGAVVIIGGGIHGRATAAELAPDYNVTLIEQFTPAHRRGSSHGEDRLTRPAPSEGIIYGVMQKISTERFERLSQTTRLEILRNGNGFHAADMTNRLNPLDWLRANSELCNRSGAPYQVMRGSEMNSRDPYFQLREDALVIMQPELRQIAAAHAMQAFRMVAESEGAQMRFNTAAEYIDYDRTSVKTTAGEVIKADKIIIAAGSWINNLLNREDRLPVTIEQHDVAFFPLKKLLDALPRAFTYEKTSGIFYGMPSGGHYMKLGNHLHVSGVLRPGEDCAPYDTAGLNVLETFIEEHMPLVSPRPARVETCKYTMMPDSHFRIGPLLAHPEVYCISACSGHGFKYAPAVAMAVRELIGGRPCGFNVGFFGLDEQGRKLRSGMPMPPTWLGYGL